MANEKQLLLPAGSQEMTGSIGSIVFIGTATVLIRFGGFTILTDPNFLHAGDHVHLGYGLFSKRRTNPAMEISDLPPLDLVILSHMHGDHFDRVATRELSKTVPIVTTQHAATSLRRKRFRATYPLSTWETLTVTKGASKLRITSMPGQHGPAVVSALLPPVMGSMLEFEDGTSTLSLYISGDTLVHADLFEIPKRYPDVDIALFHLGGTRVLGILVTMDAKQGVEAVRLIDPKVAIPIHYDDYTVFKSPLSDFVQAVKDAKLTDRVVYLERGDTYRFDAAELRGRLPDESRAPAPR